MSLSISNHGNLENTVVVYETTGPSSSIYVTCSSSLNLEGFSAGFPLTYCITRTATGSKEIVKIEQSILNSANTSDLYHKLWES